MSTASAAEKFDSARLLGQWHKSPQPALGGREPAELFTTRLGREAVAKLLGAIRVARTNNCVPAFEAAIGRSNWLLAGSLRAGKRAVAIMSHVHSAKLNGRDPYLYLRGMMERLPTQPTSQIDELLPHRWQPWGRLV